MRRSLIAIGAGFCFFLAGATADARPKHRPHRSYTPAVHHDAPIAKPTPYAGPPVEDAQRTCSEETGCQWKEASLAPTTTDSIPDAQPAAPAIKRATPVDVPKKVGETIKHVGAWAILKTRTGTARVVGWAGERFQGLVRDLEGQGYHISPGCYSPTGHMRHSKHKWGGACDFFGQYARDKTKYRQPSPQAQIALAKQHGLISGCMWRDRDCGHFEVPTHGQSVAQYIAQRGYSGRAGPPHRAAHVRHRGKRYAMR